MAVWKDDVLNKSIKQGEIYPLYFFYGAETNLMENTLSLLLKKIIPPAFESFNLQKFDGDGIVFNQFQTAYEALPMMTQYKAVVVKNWNIEKMSKNDFEIFLEMLKDPNPSTVFILYITNTNIDVKKGTKFKKVIERVTKSGIVCEFSLKDKASLKKAIVNRCAKAKVSIAPEVCEKLIDACGFHSDVLMNETDKLIQYADGGEITVQAVEELCVESIENTAFDLSNAILEGRFDKAFSILNRLFYLRIEPVMMIGALSMSFIDLYRIKTAQVIGLSSDDVIKDFQYRSKYRITKLYKDVPRFSADQIRQCLSCLEKADRLLKSSRMEAKAVMEQMLGEMFCRRLEA